MPIDRKMCNRLKEVRTVRGLTQTELAERIGVSRKTVNTVENAVMANRGDENRTSLGLRFRRVLVRTTSWAAAIQASLVLYALVAGQGSLGRLTFALGITHSSRGRIGYALITALMIFSLIVQISYNRLNAWSAEAEVDSFVRRHNSTTLLLLMFLGYLVVQYLVEEYGNVLLSRDFFLVVLFLLALASNVVFGPYVFSAKANTALAREASEDEFYRAMQAKACKAGFAVVMLAGCLALLLLQNHLAQEPAILFAVLYAGVAGSLLYYDYLIWRADRVH